MKVVIIEDEKPSARHLKNLLQDIDSEIEVVKYLDTIKSTIEYFKEDHLVDLIFLDIHLADGNSFEIFTIIPINTPFIFTTAFDNYAIQAFKQNSIDYLLKPITEKDLQFSLEKFKKLKGADNVAIIESIAQAYQNINKSYKSRFIVKKGQILDYILSEEINHFETKDSLSYLVTSKGNRYNIENSLDELETLIDPKYFFRINRKIIIQIKSIQKIRNYFNSRLSISSNYLNEDSSIVSRERVNDFKKWLDQ
jgi:DNA-binding LytR/AlgR family response regulator